MYHNFFSHRYKEQRWFRLELVFSGSRVGVDNTNPLILRSRLVAGVVVLFVLCCQKFVCMFYVQKDELITRASVCSKLHGIEASMVQGTNIT